VNQESVIRLRLPADVVRTLTRRSSIHGRLAGRPRARHITEIYFDTADETLRKGGFSLSVRTGAQCHTQVAAHGAARVSNILADKGKPDLTQIRDVDLRHLAVRLVGEGTVVPVFQVDLRTRAYPLSVDGLPVEMTVAIGQMVAPGVPGENFAELELHALDRAAAFHLAQSLAEEIAVAVERRGFVARGYDLAHGRRAQAVQAQDLTLDGLWSAWSGFTAVMRNCLDQMGANEAALAAGGGPEVVHQLRVAVRRMRAALSAFADVLPDVPTLDGFKTDLRWLQQVLGPVRDWDVFVDDTLTTLRSALPNHKELEGIAELAHAARMQALASAREALSSPRHGQFQVRLERWLSGEPSGETPLLAAFAAAALSKRDRKLRRTGKGLDGSSPERLHDIRIAAKKARYAAEFFRDLFGRKASRKYLRALRRIQDGLGVMNDADVARRLVITVKPDNRALTALLDGWFAASIVASREEIGALWRKFEKVPRYWGQTK
jgi:CHAD domain-containing protein